MNRLKFKNITFSYSSTPCIKQLSATVKRGELVGLIGANGSGKSTLLRLGLGILKPSSGTVLLDQRPVAGWSGRERASRIGYLPQSVELPLPYRVAELVTMGRETTKNEKALSVADAIALVGLCGYEERQLHTLSGGERKRAFIAMTLAQGAEILLLDEPLASLDLRYQHELIALMRRLCTEQRLTILLSLHELAICKNLDRLLLLRQGELLADGEPARVLDRQMICHAFDLPADIAL